MPGLSPELWSAEESTTEKTEEEVGQGHSRVLNFPDEQTWAAIETRHWAEDHCRFRT